jgi:hypothetical protein
VDRGKQHQFVRAHLPSELRKTPRDAPVTITVLPVKSMTSATGGSVPIFITVILSAE